MAAQQNGSSFVSEQRNLGQLSRNNTKNAARAKWLYRVGWCIPILLVVMHYLLVDRAQPTWQDEVFAISTGWSIVHEAPANLSVLGFYPNTISPERFYGPVSFQTEAALLRAFGFAPYPWRAACTLFGDTLIFFVALILLRTAGAGRWMQLIGTTIVTAAALNYCGLGRWDPVTTGCLMAGFALLLSTSESSRPAQLLRGAVAGILFAFAIGSTPRATLVLFSIGLGVIAAIFFDKAARSRLVPASAVAVFSTVAMQWILLAPLGMTPWSWFHFVQQASHGDKINSSPLLGGSWNLGVSSHKAVVILIFLLLAIALIAVFARLRDGQSTLQAVKIALTVASLVNFAITMLTVSHALGTAIFWFPLLAIMCLSWIDWKALQIPWLKYSIAVLLCVELLIPIVVEAQRGTAAFQLMRSGKSRTLAALIHASVAPGSVVIGPVGGYFFQVEQDGSRYLYIEEQTTPGLSSNTDSPAYRRHILDLAACSRPAFVLWPRTGPQATLPTEIVQYDKVELNQSQSSDPISIYRLNRPQSCPAFGGEAQEIQPFPTLR